MGLGSALVENCIWDNKTGKPLVTDLADYKAFYAPDMPEMKVFLIEPIDPVGPYGAKGIAEPAAVPTAPAIANAIYDAIGVRIRQTPITPEKILAVGDP